MPFITKDWVVETSTSEGTGNITLGGVVGKGIAFSAVCANNDTLEYSISHDTLNEIETGMGTFTTGGILVRTKVYTSTNTNALVNFSPGPKTVQMINSAERVSSTGTAGNSLALSSAVIPLSSGDVFSLTVFTTNITGFQFDVERPGRSAWIKFNTVRTLVHSSPSFGLPTAANITTAVGDYMLLIFRATGQYDVPVYYRANGQPLAIGNVTANVDAASTTAQGKVELADNTETNAGTDATRAVTPAGLAAWTGPFAGAAITALTTSNSSVTPVAPLTFTIQPNTIVSGRSYRCLVQANVNRGSTATASTFNMEFRVGGTQRFTSGNLTTQTTNGTVGSLYVDIVITFLGTGASAPFTISAWCSHTIPSATIANLMPTPLTNLTANTTAAITLDFRFVFSAAVTNLTCTPILGSIQRVV